MDDPASADGILSPVDRTERERERERERSKRQANEVA